MQKPTMEVMKKEDIRMIVVHCTATYPGQVKDVVKWVEAGHKARGFATTGYHFIITRDGVIHQCRPMPMMGAHEPLVNRISVAVALEGGVDRQNKPEANYTPIQMQALALKLWQLHQTYTIEGLAGHRDLGVPKACPCFDTRSWWRDVGYPYALEYHGKISNEKRDANREMAKKIFEPLGEEYK